ncbi:hypothetical protein OJAV_G00230690 [Oryzias javanicus]|uniref:GPS domain-containing protein n=1 Tax=Oryzias javanicus TaxID=123683 RepID=A0A3S2MC71_ORYJA|nr:hypothetical protein OJAV_G00230690 [Oryzias javanicus]
MSQNRSGHPAGEPKAFRLLINETMLQVPGPTGDLPFVVTTKQTTNATVITANISTTPPTPVTTTKATFMLYEIRGLNFTIDIEYQDSFNDYPNEVYKEVYNTILPNCRKHLNDCFIRDLVFTAGSTIVEYWIGSYVMDDLKLPNIETDVYIDMSSKYPIIFDSNQQLLSASVGDVFPGRRVTITCGPPPPDLKFGSDLNADWKLDGTVISNTAQNTISTSREYSYLTTSFNKAGKVTSECRLKNGNKIFRQRGTFTVIEAPLISVTMTPEQTLVRCGDIKTLTFQCSVQSPYTVMFVDPGSTAVPGSCPNGDIKTFTCQSQTIPTFQKYIKVEFTENALKCKSETFGDGYPGFTAKADCEEGKVGEITAECLAGGTYGNIQDNCVLKEVQVLFLQSEELTSTLLPTFVKKLGEVTVNSSSKVTQSPATIITIVNILDNVARSPDVSVNETSIKDVLLTTDVLTRKSASVSWNLINNNGTISNETSQEPKKTSSLLLESLETITKALQEESLTITTPLILLNKTTFTDTFNGNFNSSVVVDIPKHEGGKKSLTVITFSSMDTVLLPRNKDNSSTDVLNGKIVLIQSSGIVNNISITFNTSDDSLANPKCVFWNFHLFDGLGGWDDEGCFFVNQKTGTVSCNCNHLTSFSILMSPSAPDITALTYITYCGLAISMISLIICLIIEAVVWGEIRNHSTSLLRHVSSINIALSLLIADIWFIIGAGKLESQSACLAVTFFIHFFYLAMFFWMLAAALLLFSRTILVLSQDLSDRAMVGIGFTLGYGAPLIIAAITIGVTAPSENYIQEIDVCWLRWKESRTLLAFVIPALAIQ